MRKKKERKYETKKATRTHALHLLETSLIKCYVIFIHRLLISHFFFSCDLRFPNRSRLHFSFLLSHSYFLSIFILFLRLKSFLNKCIELNWTWKFTITIMYLLFLFILFPFLQFPSAFVSFSLFHFRLFKRTVSNFINHPSALNLGHR